MPTLPPGTAAPEIELAGAEGKQYSLKEALGRGPVLAAFFKVGCPTCQFALPFVERLHRQFGGKSATIWGVSQDNAEATREFAKKYGITFPVLIDDHPYETSSEYRLKFTPTLFLVTSDGRIEQTSEGFSKSDFLAVQKWFSKELHASAPPLFEPHERIPEYKPG